MQHAVYRALILICLFTASSCEKASSDFAQWDYRFDLSSIFQTPDRATDLQAFVFGGDTTVVYQQATPGDPVIETEALRLPPGFGGARGSLLGLKIDSLSVFITYAATVSYDHPDWKLDARTYYYKYGDTFDINDLWGIYTDMPPEYRPKIFDPLLRVPLDTIAGPPPGIFLFKCEINKYLIEQLQ